MSLSFFKVRPGGGAMGKNVELGASCSILGANAFAEFCSSVVLSFYSRVAMKAQIADRRLCYDKGSRQQWLYAAQYGRCQHYLRSSQFVQKPS